MGNESDFLHKDATVIFASDDLLGISYGFIIMREKTIMFSFPTSRGGSKLMTRDEMMGFLEKMPPSDMLSAIKKAWLEKQDKEKSLDC